MPIGEKNDFIYTLDLAGLTIEIRSTTALVHLDGRRFQPFYSAVRQAQFRVRIQALAAADMDGPPLDPESDHRLAKAGRRGTCSALLCAGQVKTRLDEASEHTELLFVEILPETLSILDFHDNRADFFFVSGKHDLSSSWIGPAMLAPFLPDFDACLLHASAIVLNGRAAVFLAPDEGGKTTAVCLSPSGTIIGDDQVLVRRFPEGFRVFGTPWGLHVNGKLHAPLAGLFLLEKSNRFSLVPLPGSEMIAHIWQETKNPLSILPRQLKKKAFALVCEIASAVPARKISFAKEYIDWEAINKTIAG